MATKNKTQITQSLLSAPPCLSMTHPSLNIHFCPHRHPNSFFSAQQFREHDGRPFLPCERPEDEGVASVSVVSLSALFTKFQGNAHDVNRITHQQIDLARLLLCNDDDGAPNCDSTNSAAPKAQKMQKIDDSHQVLPTCLEIPYHLVMKILEYHPGIVMSLTNAISQSDSLEISDEASQVFDAQLATNSLVNWRDVFMKCQSFSSNISWHLIFSYAARLFYGYFAKDPERKIFCVFPAVHNIYVSPLCPQLLRHVVPWHDLKYNKHQSYISAVPPHSSSNADVLEYLRGLDTYMTRTFARVHYMKTSGNSCMLTFDYQGSQTFSDTFVAASLTPELDQHPFCRSLKKLIATHSRITGEGLKICLMSSKNMEILRAMRLGERIVLTDEDPEGLVACFESSNHCLRELRLSPKSVGMRFAWSLHLYTRLRTLVLESVDFGFYRTGSNPLSVIFRHPTLRNFAFTCVEDLPQHEDAFDGLNLPGCSVRLLELQGVSLSEQNLSQLARAYRLETLRLIDCDVSNENIELLLGASSRLPWTLRSLNLQENRSGTMRLELHSILQSLWQAHLVGPADHDDLQGCTISLEHLYVDDDFAE